MRPYKKIAERRAANKAMTNKGRTKAFVRGFEDAIARIDIPDGILEKYARKYA